MSELENKDTMKIQRDKINAGLPQDTATQLTWVGDITTELEAGKFYVATVTGDITSLDITMTTDGECRILIVNDGPYTIAEPTSGYKMTSSGLDDLSASSVRLGVQRDTVIGLPQYEYSATERVAL